MFFQAPLAGFYEGSLANGVAPVQAVVRVAVTVLDKAVRSAGGCTTALTVVLITGMPAGSTSAILAAKYGCDYTFATKCIVVSTMFSMLSIPLWGMMLG